MARKYYCDFKNETDRTWTMGVYQDIPNSIGLDSVSWKQTTTPTGGLSGVSWDISYNVALADYKQDGGKGVYTASQTLGATLGSVWECRFQDGVQQLHKVSETIEPDHILIKNISNRFANLGIGMSGVGSVYKKEVPSGAGTQFKVTPTFWAGLFADLELGEVISSNVIVGPETLKYPSGMNAATLTATMDGDKIVLDVTYSNRTTVSASTIEARLAFAKELKAA